MTRETVAVLFLCTGNSCRSQMAEGWAKKLGGDKLQVASAGIEAHGLNSRAVAVMKEESIDITNQKSTILKDEMLNSADYLITLCGDADERCPILPSRVKKEHWAIADPAKATGSEEEIMNVFRAVCLEIKTRTSELIKRLDEKIKVENSNE